MTTLTSAQQAYSAALDRLEAEKARGASNAGRRRRQVECGHALKNERRPGGPSRRPTRETAPMTGADGALVLSLVLAFLDVGRAAKSNSKKGTHTWLPSPLPSS